jgi:hypothetical protein
MWEISEGALDKGDLATLGQIQHFSTCQPMFYLFSNTIPNMLCLIGSSNGRPRYLTGREDTPHPRIYAKLPTRSMFPTIINSDLAKLTFNPEAALYNRKRLCK